MYTTQYTHECTYPTHSIQRWFDILKQCGCFVDFLHNEKKNHPHDKDFFIHWGTLYLSVCSQCMKTRQLPWAHTVGCCYLNCNNSQSSSPISYLVYFFFDITNKMTSSLVIVKVTARTLIIRSLPGNNIFAHTGQRHFLLVTNWIFKLSSYNTLSCLNSQ